MGHIDFIIDRSCRIRRSSLTLFVLLLAFSSTALAADSKKPQQAAASPKLEAALKDLFRNGIKIGRQNLSKANSAATRARLLNPHDPRIDYAHGLILLKNIQWDQAAKKFESAVGNKKQPYLPAWQAQIWMNFVRKKHSSGISELAALTNFLVKNLGEDGPSDEQLETAQWIGQAVAAADLCISAPASQAELTKLLDQIDLKFQGKLLAAFEAGIAQVQKQQSELTERQKEQLAKREKLLKAKNQQRQENLDSDLKELKRQSEDSDKLATDAKQWFEDTLISIEKQLAQLERGYQLLEKQHTQVNQTMLQLRQEMLLIELRERERQSFQNQSRNTSSRINFPNANENQYRELDRQYLERSQEKRQLELQASQVVQQAQKVLAVRNGSIKKYQQTTGQIVKKTADLNKWSKRLEVKKKTVSKLKKKAATPKKTVSRKSSSFRTYVKLDLATERDRLFQSYGISTKPENK